MMNKRIRIISIVVLFMGSFPMLGGVAEPLPIVPSANAAAHIPANISPSASSSSQSLDTFDKLPMQFEPNAGQTDPSVRFMARTPGGTIFFTPSEVVLSLVTGISGQETDIGDLSAEEHGKVTAPTTRSQSVVMLRFVGADPAANLTGGAPLPGKVNYILGSDASKWHTGLPTYSGITYEGLYPGVSLEYVGKDGSLKGTYTVEPQSDPSRIRWRYDGATNVRVDNGGNLLIEVPVSASADGDSSMTLTEQAPIAWQELTGGRIAVDTRYEIAADGSIGFALGAYDRSQPLIIDPTLTLYYFTFLGGGGADYGRSIAVDGAGNAYVTGWTYSTDFVTTPGAYRSYNAGDVDTFVTKLDPNGAARIYSTYLGGSGYDPVYSIAVDSGNSAYLTGHTRSTNFPTTDAGTMAGTSDAFVTKLTPGGLLDYSRFLGGAEIEYGTSVAVDTAGSAYLTGLTNSTDFPVENELQPCGNGGDDAFVTKLPGAGVGDPLYSTCLGTADNDSGNGIALEGVDNAYVTGVVGGTGFPITLNTAFQKAYGGGTRDVFVTRLRTTGPSTGQLIYSTYLGHSAQDSGRGIAALEGHAYVVGSSASSEFPLRRELPMATPDKEFQVIVANLDTNSSTDDASLIYSTFFGGSEKEEVWSIAVDSCGNVFFAGDTMSDWEDDDIINNPIPSGGGTWAGLHDGYVAQLRFDGTTLSLPYSSYLGGTGEDIVRGIALDSSGYLYVTGETSSASFYPATHPNPVQPNKKAGWEAFVARIDPGDVCSTSVDICPCPMDVSFVLDVSRGLQTTLTQLRNAIPDIISDIEVASGGDYRVSLVTFKDDISVWDMGPGGVTGGVGAFQSWSAIGSNGNIPDYAASPTEFFYGHGATTLLGAEHEPEASDEALRTVLEERTSASRGFPPADSNFPCSAFTNVRLQHRASITTGECGPTPATGPMPPAHFGPWRLGNVRRIVVFFTDARPGGFTDKYDPLSTLPKDLANLAGLRNIQIVALQDCATCGSPTDTAPTIAASITNNYTLAYNGAALNGQYIPLSSVGVPIIPQNGLTIRDQVSKFIKDCEWTATWSSGGRPIFKDVDLSNIGRIPHKFVIPIYKMGHYGVLGGYPCGSPGEPCVPPDNLPYFRPDNYVTRGQASKIVANAAGFSEPAGTQTFADVSPSNTFFVYVQRMAARGIIGGYPCGGTGEPCDPQSRPYFRPNANVTRGQLSKIVSNAAGFSGTPSNQYFADVPVSNTFYPFIMRLLDRDATNAIPCGARSRPCNADQQRYFGPNIPATRGETALFVANSFYPEVASTP